MEAKIANLRRIDWRDLGINFVTVLSPGVLDGAPYSLHRNRSGDRSGRNAIAQCARRTLCQCFGDSDPRGLSTR